MSAAVTTGVFTLGGVIVGGLLNTALAASLEERRTRRGTRTAARIVGEEMATIAALLKATPPADDWSPMGDTPLNFNGWQHYRQALADRLSDKDWQALQTAVRDAQMIDRRRAAAQGRLLTPPDERRIDEALDSVEQAAAILHETSARG